MGRAAGRAAETVGNGARFFEAELAIGIVNLPAGDFALSDLRPLAPVNSLGE